MVKNIMYAFLKSAYENRNFKRRIQEIFKTKNKRIGNHKENPNEFEHFHRCKGIQNPLKDLIP